jgi:FHA domain-containing protein
MLILRVVQPASVARNGLVGRFGSSGGTVGRASDCTLSLPDPQKHVSRVQAELRCAGDTWVLLNRSEVTPMSVNGAVVAPGASVRLADGDRLTMGDFLLAAEFAADAGAPAEQFDGLLSPGARSGADIGRLGGSDPVSPPDDIFSGLKQFFGQSEKPPETHGTSPSASVPDPFARPPAQPPSSDPLGMFQPGGAAAPWAPDRGIDVRPPHTGSDPSIDDLFGLSGESAPLDPLAPPITADAVGRIATDAAMSDHGPEIHAAVRLPRFDAPPPEAPRADAIYRSWESPGEVPRTVIVARGGRHGAPRQPADPFEPASHSAIQDVPAEIVERVAQAHHRSFEAPPKTRPTELINGLNRESSTADPAGRNGSGPEAADLLDALLRGAGLPGQPRSGRAGANDSSGLDAATMHRIGRLLAASTEGTLQLLAARSSIKQEMRAEVTMIAARENNPLKFSPDASAALGHLLATGGVRGFMDGPVAVKDAFDDLLAHQVAVVVGMRAALQALTARFDPALLEQRLDRRASMLDSMLPMARKARLWELFGELYQDIVREAQDDFDSLFGREFVKAYEAQLRKLEGGKP